MWTPSGSRCLPVTPACRSKTAKARGGRLLFGGLFRSALFIIFGKAVGVTLLVYFLSRMLFLIFLGFGVRDSGFGIRDSGFGIRDSVSGVRGSGFGKRSSGFGIR